MEQYQWALLTSKKLSRYIHMKIDNITKGIIIMLDQPFDVDGITPVL